VQPLRRVLRPAARRRAGAATAQRRAESVGDVTREQGRVIEAAAQAAGPGGRHRHDRVGRRPGGAAGGRCDERRQWAGQFVDTTLLEQDDEVPQHVFVRAEARRRLPGRWDGAAVEARPVGSGLGVAAHRAAGVGVRRDRRPTTTAHSGATAAPGERPVTDSATCGQERLGERRDHRRHGRRVYQLRDAGLRLPVYSGGGGGMRRLLFVALLLAAAGAAEAQVIWVTAGAGTTFEINPATEPDESWSHYGDVVPSLSLGLSVNEDLHVRLRAAELPYDLPYGGEAWPARIGAVTVGADYFFKGVLGAPFSLAASAGTTSTSRPRFPGRRREGNFGWYIGVGEVVRGDQPGQG
jgi:hypothetical protein